MKSFTKYLFWVIAFFGFSQDLMSLDSDFSVVEMENVGDILNPSCTISVGNPNVFFFLDNNSCTLNLTNVEIESAAAISVGGNGGGICAVQFYEDAAATMPINVSNYTAEDIGIDTIYVSAVEMGSVVPCHSLIEIYLNINTAITTNPSSLSAIDLGTILPNTNTTYSFDFENLGCATLTYSISLTNTSSGTIGTINSTNGIISPDATETFTVDIFTGANTGTFAYVIEMTLDNGGSGIQTVNSVLFGYVGCVISGDVVLTSQSDVDDFIMNYGDCEILNGNLIISDDNDGNDNILNIDSLVNLVSISGSFFCEFNEQLINIDGLSNLVNVGGNLRISICSSLPNLDGLSKLEIIGGDLSLFSNYVIEDIDGLSSLKAIFGNLFIHLNSLLNIDGLSNLDTIGQNLDIHGNGTLTNLNGLNNITGLSGNVLIESNNSLTNLNGLANITSIGGSLQINENQLLVNIEGLTSVESVGGFMFINNNNSLQNVNGCINIQSVGDYLQITNNNALLNIDSLANIYSVGGWLEVSNNDELGNLDGLINISNTGDYLAIRDNSKLIDIDGLNGVTSVGGFFVIEYCPLIENIDGISNLVSIGNSGGVTIQHNLNLKNLDGLTGITNANVWLTIVDNPNLLNLNGLSNLTSVSNGTDGFLTIQDNPLITDLNGLTNLTNVESSVTVYNNAALSECCAFFDLITNNGGNSTIFMSNNLGNCNNNGADIIQPCGVTSTFTITQQPQNLVLCEAQTATFSVSASSNSTITYQWQVNQNDGNGFVNIAGATSDILTITNVTPTFDGYMYQVEMSTPNTGTIVSDAVTLNVHPEIEFDNIFIFDLEECEGDDYLITGIDPNINVWNSLQWQVDEGAGFNDIVGATNTFYEITDLMPNQNGNVYRLVAENECGVSESEGLDVFVQNAIAGNAFTFSPNPSFDGCDGSNIGEFLGSDPNSNPVLSGGNGIFDYRWFFGTDTLNSILITPSMLSPDYTIPTISDTTYFARKAMSGRCDDLTYYFMIPLQPTPSITSSTITTICEGETTTISVTATGGNTLTYLWNTGETTEAIAVSPTESTGYLVTVTNSFGCSEIGGVTVTVNPSPNISLISQTNLTCPSLPEGIIEVTAMSGTTPYQFDLGNGNQSTSLFQNLAAGTYNISATDANGCMDVLTTTLTAPTPTTFLDYEGNGVFENEIIFPKIGTPQTDFTFKVKYTDVNGNFPNGGVPKLRLDFEGNGQFTNSNDLIFLMQENDVADTDVTDGKDYFYNVTVLPAGMDYETSIIVESNNCPTILIADAPDVLLLPDVEVRTNNIMISNPNPVLGEEITISAVIQNNSDFVASNFDVQFLNQFDMSTSTVAIGMLAPHQNTVVEWTFTTSMMDSWNPVQVIVDVNNVINEANEFNNQAIRPFCNGDFACGGNISISANTTPSSQVSSSNGSVTLSGHAEYINTAVVLTDPSVAGATVDFTILETGASYTTFTNSNGNFSTTFNASQAVGVYHIEGTITDYTITENFTASFEITNNSPSCHPDLDVELNLNPFPNPILEGQAVTITGDVIVSVNNYEDATDVSGNISQPDGGENIPINIPTLSAGTSQTFNLDGFNTSGLAPGTYSFHASASANFSCPETTYSNNNDGASIVILPNEPDLVPNVHSVSTSYLQCQMATFIYRIRNIGGVASITSTAQLDIKFDNNLEDSYQIIVPAIAAQGQTFVTFSHAFANVGTYQLEMKADATDTNSENNETNNEANGSTFSSMCVPNVICSGFNFSPANPLDETNITLTAHFRNVGTATASGPFLIEFSNGMSQTYNGNLVPGESASVQITIPTPTNCPTISFTINGNQGCSRELGWDLTLSNFCNNPTMWWNHNQSVGQGILFNIGTKNTSSFLAENVEVKFEIVSEGYSNTVTTNFVSNGCPNNVSNDEIFVFPNSGTYEVKITIDPNNQYPECDESNNVFTAIVNVEDMPDLQVLSSNINPEKLNPDLDEDMFVEITFENVGNTSITDPFTIELMRDNTIVNEITVSDNLLPNASSSIQFPVVSAGNPEGLHVFRAIVDNANVISETTESNNEATRSYIVGDAVNFTVQNCSVDNPSPFVNETVNFSFDLENKGAVSGEFDLKVSYQKDDGTTENIFLQHYTLNGNETISETVVWVVLDETTTIEIEIYNPSLPEFNEFDNDCVIILNGFTLAASQTDASCFENNDGAASVTVQGGTLPFNYSWSNLETTSSITNLSPGSYSVTVSDNFGNIKEETFAIGPADLTADLINSSNVSTIGGNDGSIEVQADGNTSPYQFNIGNGNQSTGLFPNLIAGTYEITVTDNKGCTETISETLTQPTDPLMIDGISTTEIMCFGTSDGTAEIFVSGGTSPYQFDIGNDSQLSNIFENLAAGNYTVTVTDAQNATATGNFEIEDNNIFGMFTEIMVEEEVSCFSSADGAFSLETYFGQAPYQHSIGNGTQSSSYFENLAAMTYTFTVVDANGCSTTGMVTLNEPDSLIVETQMITDASCFGLADGSLNFVKSGGSSGTIYNIGNGNQSSSFFPNLAAGDYTVTVTDGNGCSDTEMTTVGEPDELMVTIQSVTNSTTQGGGNDGEFTISAMGGTMPYLFDIGSQNNSNGQFTNLSAGTYNVTATDANNCSAVTSVTIMETNLPCPPMADFSYSNNALEVIFTNNSIDATSYIWDFGDTNSSTETNPTHTYTTSGTYTVTLTATSDLCGGAGDIYTETITVYAPENIIFEMDNYSGFPDDTLTIPVTILNFNDVTTFQFSIMIDTALVEFVQENGENIFGGQIGDDSSILTIANADGTMPVNWYTPFGMPVSLMDNDTLFNFKLRIKDAGNVCAPLNFSNMPTAMQVSVNGINLANFINIDGEICVFESLNISGKIEDPQGNPVNLVEVDLSGSKNEDQITSIDGTYHFTDIISGGSYDVCSYKFGNLTNGVNGLDIQAIQEHILGIDTFTNLWQYLAADVIDLGVRISGPDIFQIQQAILGNISDFPVGGSYTMIPDSVYWNSPLTATNLDTCFHYQNFTADTLNQNFLAIKYGDVDNTANPMNFVGAGEVFIGATEISAYQGDTVLVPIYAYEINNLMGFQWTNSWNPEVLEFIEITNFNEQLNLNPTLNFGRNLNNLESGNLSFLWNAPTFQPISIEDSLEIFALKFVVIGEEGSVSNISINSNVTNVFAFNSNKEQVQIIEKVGRVEVNLVNDTKDFENTHQLKIYPNPVQNILNIELNLDYSKKVKISLFNTTNQLLQSQKQFLSNGLNTISISVDEFPKGVYWLEIEVGEEHLYKKVILQ